MRSHVTGGCVLVIVLRHTPVTVESAELALEALVTAHVSWLDELCASSWNDSYVNLHPAEFLFRSRHQVTLIRVSNEEAPLKGERTDHSL